MKRSKIILIIILLIAAVAVLYFAYGVVKDRYFGAKTKIETKNGEAQTQTEESTGENQESASPDIGTAAPAEGRPNIQNADCGNDCASFKDNPDNLKYCREACGDRPVAPKESEAQCENLSSLEKDSCWRDLAVSKKDIDICEKISDAKLKKVCVSRVTEEILN